jgi:hypothetical protein
MATSLTHLRAALTGLATVYCVVAMAGNARADESRAVAHVPPDLVQWHSELSGSGESGAKPEWKSTLTTIDPQDSTAYLVMHGAAGLRDAADGALDHSREPFLPAGNKVSLPANAR